MLDSKALTLLQEQGFVSTEVGEGNYKVTVCPLNPSHGEGKFFIKVGGDDDGLWDCKVCGESGNLYQLKERLGLLVPNVASVKEAANAKVRKPLPNLENWHSQLLNNTKYDDVLDYLIAERKFTMDVIEQQKIGVVTHRDTDGKECLYYSIPYFNKEGKPIYYKARSVPPAKKDFKSPAGYEAPLYNATWLAPGMDEVLIVEGEADALSLLSNGYTTVVGVPGSGIKKAAWIDQLLSLEPKQIYLCYDNDKPGQDGAREMATRIGLDKVKNVLLPANEILGPDGQAVSQIKDVNEFFVAGGTLEEFRKLLDAAKPFDVNGVQSVIEVLDDLKKELTEKGSEPSYCTPWPSLTNKLGGYERSDLIGLMAEGKVGKTTTGVNWADFHANEYGEVSMVYCMEMPPKRLARKWVAFKTGVPDTFGDSKITPTTVDEALGLAATMEGDLLFGYNRTSKNKEVFETIYQAHKRYGVNFLVFDNLQLLVRSLQNATQETSRLTKDFKALAMELNIVILLIIQPHRVGEGQIIAARNAANSSAIEKDVDAMICLHRNRVAGDMKEKDFTGYIDIPENFEPYMLTRVDLCRYGTGGSCVLHMDGATSTVTEWKPDENIGSKVTLMDIPVEEAEEV